MHPIVLIAGMFIILAATAVPAWFWRERVQKRRLERDRLRQLMHGLRKNPRPEEVEDVRLTCTRYGLSEGDVGTYEGELLALESQAHLLIAQGVLRRMRAFETDPREEGFSKLCAALASSGRPHDWASLGTTWQELGDLQRRGLLEAARRRLGMLRGKQMRRGSSEHAGDVEELLALAGASLHELEAGLDAEAWDRLKAAA